MTDDLERQDPTTPLEGSHAPLVEPESDEPEPVVADVDAGPALPIATEPEPAEPSAQVADVDAVPALPVAPEPATVPLAVPTAPVVTAAPDDLVPLDELAPAIAAASVSRRRFLGFGLAVGASLAGGLAGAAVLARYFPVFAEPAVAAEPIVPTYDPASKQWAFVVDTAACIGCGLCVAACKEENKVPEEGSFNRTWVERHTVTTDGTVYVDSPEGGIDGFPPESTAPGAAGKPVADAFFEPRLCMQCSASPCTTVCPVGATYRTPDGVILVDARRCIGCGYCVVACPYGARYLVPAGPHAPSDTPGVADKCTWCYHRISRDLLPACVEVCPVGARKFGDAADPNSEIATIVRERDPQMLDPEFGTQPRVLYLGPSIEEA
jgi:Fe-S-cluster-containing dehydrogenase component